MKYTVRPLSDRTWLRPSRQREWSRFDSTWTSTLKLLSREVGLLAGRDVVIEIDVPERAIRLDGGLRADARPTCPAVVVAFESKHGPMLYRSDLFESRWVSKQGPGWQQNVRAVALTLESLRAVDRYGATETGQQYAGFKALPAGTAMPASHMTHDEAVHTLITIAGPDADWDDDATLYRKARIAAHPDRRGGDQTLWDQVEQAARVLGLDR